ncbi:MAG TPA: hypothetical protein PLX09_08355, partial [Xanthomonadaceae bacterium]|nr:hypothetical protein [Xanthomonadaceae bacterium]
LASVMEPQPRMGMRGADRKPLYPELVRDAVARPLPRRRSVWKATKHLRAKWTLAILIPKISFRPIPRI